MTKPYGLISIQFPDGDPEEFSISQEIITIGRNPDNEIVLGHGSISRAHARLHFKEGKFYLEDLGSTHGTFIDGRRLPAHQPVPLQVGQEVRLGSVTLSLHPTPKPNQSPARHAWLPILAPLATGGVLVIICISVILIFWRMRARQNIKERVCDQPAMTVIRIGGKDLQSRVVSSPRGVTVAPMNIESSSAEPLSTESLVTDSPITEPVSTTATAETAPQDPTESVQLILSTAFLELPFPYDGSNENFGGTLEQFRRASQIYLGGGRINSYFDHLLPLYPEAYNGKEPERFSGKLLIFDGSLRPDVDYSGHPGYDFKTFEHRQPTTPLFAAADGIVTDVGEHGASGALYVRIVHTVEGVGDFRTTYWHLHPDEFFEAMQGREGQPIAAGTRIGTMGNTGFSSGHHLHFEVRFDRNGDSYFGEGERVDPYGYIPSEEFPQDPWVGGGGIPSQYLWIHPLGMVAEVGSTGGGSLTPPDGTGGEIGLGADREPVSVLCAKRNSLPPGGKVYWSWGLDPPPSQELQGIGKSVVISIVDPNGVPLGNFDTPLDVVIPFDETELGCIDPDSLRIYWFDPDTGVPMELETDLNSVNGVARANTARPGKFSILGMPTCDTIAPRTEILASGRQSPDGTWYEDVRISLESLDPSGIQRIEFSLDGGSTWQQYRGPFTLEPSGIPEPDYVMDEQFFGLGPGRTLVMAVAVDGAGNIEDPPAFQGILIDPSKDPDAPTYTPIPTPTPTHTHTPTPTATVTSPACATQLNIIISANCRMGPGPDYPVIKPLPADITLDLLGQNKDPNVKWWQIAFTDSSGPCWVSGNLVSMEGDTSPECVLEVDVAPPPTATFTPTPEPPSNQPPPAPTDLFPPPPVYKFDCTTMVKLSWSKVSDSDGIMHYEWQAQRSSGDNTGPFSDYTSDQPTSTGAMFNVDCDTWYRWRVRAVDGTGLPGPYTDWHLIYIKP